MSSDEMWLAVGGAVALLLLVCLLALAAAVRRAGRRQAALADRVSALEATLAAGPAPEAGTGPAAAGPTSYVITGIDRDDPPVQGRVPGHVDAPLFADIVARESVVKAAGLVHGLRRALAPEARNRIRFEMGREVKRSRRQRRSDLKAALREMQARERAQMADQRDEGDAA